MHANLLLFKTRLVLDHTGREPIATPTRNVMSMSLVNQKGRDPLLPTKELLSAKKASRSRSRRRAMSMTVIIRLASSYFAKWNTT